MALVTIMLACLVGFFTGMVQFAFLGAGIGQAFLTYLTVSLGLSGAALVGAMVRMRLAPANDGNTVLQDDLEAWQDWHTEEAMEAERQMELDGDLSDAERPRRSA